MNNISKKIIDLLPYWHFGIERTIKKQYRPSDTHPHPVSYEGYFCLLLLEIKGEMTMNDLSQSLRIRKQQASPLVDKLEGNGLVARTVDQEDHRILRVKLSPEGKRYIIDHSFDLSMISESIDANLSPDDLDSLEEALTTLASLLPKFS